MSAEFYERDGIRYEISVEARSGQFFAQWTCPVCKRSGGPTHWYHFEKEAIDRNKVSSFIEHHTVFHMTRCKAAS